MDSLLTSPSRRGKSLLKHSFGLGPRVASVPAPCSVLSLNTQAPSCDLGSFLSEQGELRESQEQLLLHLSLHPSPTLAQNPGAQAEA